MLINNKTISTLIISFSLIVNALSNDIKLANKSLGFDIQETDLSIIKMNIFGKPFDGNGEVSFVDGKNGKKLTISDLSSSMKKTEAQINHGFKEHKSLKATHKISFGKEYILYEIEAFNESSDELWLECSLSLPFQCANNSFAYWNGFKEAVNPDSDLSMDSLKGLFPLSAAYSDGKGIALGITPNNLRSYLKADWRASSKNLSYSTKMALGKNESDKIQFIIFAFESNFAWRDAVQKYYDYFPAFFLPAKNTDPRLRKSAAQYFCHNMNFQNYLDNFELLRKCRCGADWFYGLAAGIRVGDWWPTKLTLGWTDKNGKTFTEKDIKAEMDSRTKKVINALNYDLAVMVYTIPNFAEKDLVQKSFPGCEAQPKDPSVRLLYDPWVFKNQANLLTFPYGNDFQKKLFKDLGIFVDKWPISGFCFDCGLASDPHFGKGAENTPGKAYSSGKGVFSTIGAATAKVAEHVHSFERNDVKMGVLINLCGADAYYSMTAADAAIYEHPPNFFLYGYDPEHLKLLLGKKALTWWFGYKVPDSQSMSKERLLTALKGLVDYTLLISFKLGAYPNPSYALGVPKMLSYMPSLTELISELGWEPSPGFKADKGLWLSRYGKDAGACLVLSNASMKDIETEVVVLNKYLNAGIHLFAGYEGEEYKNEFKEGLTILKAKAKSRYPTILRSVASFEAKESLLEGRGFFSFETGGKGRIFLKINSSENIAVPGKLWIKNGWLPVGLNVNGTSVNFGKGPGCASAKLPLKTGPNTIELLCESLYKIDSLKKLEEFVFFKDNKPACDIVISKNATSSEKLFAAWIQNFFHVYYKYECKIKTAKMPIVTQINADDGKSHIYIETSVKPNGENSAKASVKVENGNIYISGGNADDLKRMVLELLDVLDKKYIFYGYFTGDREPRNFLRGDTPVSRKLGIVKSFLPYYK